MKLEHTIDQEWLENKKNIYKKTLSHLDRYFAREICEWLRNKSWKPECVGSFNMDWRILVFYPEPEARDKIY